MTFTRRDLLRLMLGTALAEAIDVERLLWIPKPIITVPAMPRRFDTAYRRSKDGGTTIVAKLLPGEWTFVSCLMIPGDRLMIGERSIAVFDDMDSVATFEGQVRLMPNEVPDELVATDMWLTDGPRT